MPLSKLLTTPLALTLIANAIPFAALAQDPEPRVAIVVGVGAYPRNSGFSKLDFARQDAEAIAEVLGRAGFTVLPPLLDGQATKASIRKELEKVKQGYTFRRNGRRRGQVLFFFSGHGDGLQGGNFLAAADSDTDNFATSGLPLKTVQELVSATGARDQILWVDACRGSEAKGARNAHQSKGLVPAASASQALMLATAYGKVSWEDPSIGHGVFSHHVVAALDDALNAGRRLTLIGLYETVDETVRAFCAEHCPNIQEPKLAGEFSSIELTRAARIVVDSKAPKTLRDGMTYVWVPAPPGGQFLMGCPPGKEEDCEDVEKPAKPVELRKGFWMAEHETSQDAWGRVVGENPSKFEGPSLPVNSVTWEQANGYCVSLGLRLPTAPEWEWAARGGTTGARYGNLDAIAWYDKNSDEKPHPVKNKGVNAYGLYDMLGNVLEWTSTDYNSVQKELRGGSWLNSSGDTRASARFRSTPSGSYRNGGFRCAGELP